MRTPAFHLAAARRPCARRLCSALTCVACLCTTTLVAFVVGTVGSLLLAGTPDDDGVGSITIADNAAVAVVDGEPITAAELRHEMKLRCRAAHETCATSRAWTDLLNEMVAFELLLAHARRAGTDRDPEVRRTIERLIVGRFKQDRIERRLEAVSVSDEEIEDYYDAHRDAFTIPERRRVAMIAIDLPAGASEQRLGELRERAEQARAAALELGEEIPGFGSLARQVSDDPVSRHLGGDVGWIARGQDSYRWPQSVVEAMFALADAGEISPLVETERAFCLLRLIEREPATLQPLEPLRANIRHRLLQEKKRHIERDFYAELEANTEIERHPELLDWIAPPEGVARRGNAPRPPAIPGP
ncbi:MAG: peptidyl-prolyl cis-trans isomerase [Acidobacteriota bacterium]|nr:MAG: peptidyl-prolyl cis-trans isomerase [Acidobacteriota bacterium]